MMTLESFIVIITVVIIPIVALILEYIKRPKNFPPGLIRLPILGSLPFLKLPIHLGFEELSKTYGPIFSLYLGNFPVVVLCNAKLIREAFRNEVFSGRPPLRPAVERGWGVIRGLVFTTGEHFHQQRKFTIRTLRDFGFGKGSMESLINDEVIELVQRLKDNLGQPIEIGKRFNIAVLNSLWHILAGERYPQDDPKLSEILERLLSVIDKNSVQGAFYFMPWLTKLFPVISGYRKSMNSMNPTIDFLFEKINEHKSTFDPNNKRDFIDVYLQEIQNTTESSSSFYKDDGEKSLVITLMDIIAAGSDTTSTTLTWGILYAILNPHVQTKIQEEIERVIGLTTLPSLSDRPRMPYMEAFIAETLRQSSIVPIAIFHSTLSDIKFEGFNLPKDTIIIPNLWQVHYNETYWGDPKSFRPERFINENGEFKKDENLLAFSTGKRNCIGENLARDQLFLFFTGLFQHFTFEVNSNEPLPVPEPNNTYNTLIVKPKPFTTVLKLK